MSLVVLVPDHYLFVLNLNLLNPARETEVNI